jgi:hypothetical protein
VVQPEPQIVTVTEKVPLRIYQPPLPGEIDLLNVNFFVITEENYEEKKKEIEKILDGNFVVFALTPDGYEKMAENFQEVRRYVRQQKELIIYYREATTESEGTTAEEWQTRLKMLEMKYNQLLSRTELLQRRLSDAENALVAGGLRSKKPLA